MRLNFHSSSSILLGNQKNADISQINFMYYIFAPLINDDSTNFIFDNGLVLYWLKGESRVSPKIVSYYVTDSL